MAEDKKEKVEIKSWIPWTIAVAFCLAVWAGGAWFMRWYAVTYRSSFDNVTAGTFGDSFGAVNALISALAFGGVIVSFWLQRKEYELQRKDLKLQYAELQAQRDEFSQQNCNDLRTHSSI